MNKKGIIIITGASLREAKKIFRDTNKSDLLKFQDKFYKINAASGAALLLNKQGYIVYVIGSSKKNLQILSSFFKGSFYINSIDLSKKKNLETIKAEIEYIKKKYDLDIHLVHYGSASETKIPLPNNSIFLSPWEIPPQAIVDLISINIVPFLGLLQMLRPIFKNQTKTKVITITAIAATRALPLALLDNVQKGAVHSTARSLALDLTKENIYITEIMPGTTDTGFYDNEFTLTRDLTQSKEFGYNYKKDFLPVFSGQKVGEAVVFALETDCHIREISLIPFGQYPHLGA